MLTTCHFNPTSLNHSIYTHVHLIQCPCGYYYYIYDVYFATQAKHVYMYVCTSKLWANYLIAKSTLRKQIFSIQTWCTGAGGKKCMYITWTRAHALCVPSIYSLLHRDRHVMLTISKRPVVYAHEQKAHGLMLVLVGTVTLPLRIRLR